MNGSGKAWGCLVGLLVSAIIAYYKMPSIIQKRDDQPNTVKYAVDPNRLREHVKALATDIGQRSPDAEDSLKKAEEYITSCLKAKYPKNWKQAYSIQNKYYSNLVFEKEGKYPSLPYIIVGANYDSFPASEGTSGSPGADANASGVAVLVELADLLSSMETERNFRFVFFTLKEGRHFNSSRMGSRRYVSSIFDKEPKAAYMVCLDGLGYYDEDKDQKYPEEELKNKLPAKANFLLVVGRMSDEILSNAFQKVLKKTNPFPVNLVLLDDRNVDGWDYSDHREFWRRNIPALLLTDTAPYRNPNYHKAEDKAETLNYEKMSQVTESLKAGLLELEKNPALAK